MNIFAIVSSLIIILGCFLPWLQLGPFFAFKGIDSVQGGFIIILSIITGTIGFYNQSKKQSKNSWTYLLFGFINLAILFLTIVQAYDKAAPYTEGLGELGSLIGSELGISIFDFIGNGIYMVVIGIGGLIISGFIGMLIKDKVSDVKPTAITNKPIIKTNSETPKNEQVLLKELRDEGILTAEEYSRKLNEIEFNSKLQEKIQPLIKILIESKEKGLLSEEEFIEKKNGLIESQSKTLKDWMNNKLKISDISPLILEQLQDHHKNQLQDLINKIVEPETLVKNVIVMADNKVKLIDKERWEAIQKQGPSDKFRLIYEKST